MAALLLRRLRDLLVTMLPNLFMFAGSLSRKQFRDDHRDVVHAAALIGQVNEVLSGFGHCVMRYDIEDLGLLNMACEAITAQEDDVALGKLDRPLLNLSRLLHAKGSRDAVAPGV
jgi:hypothetical protein